ncbi:hypothetical protein [Bradyrhizobium aeschynomenes]|uniref:hypothetical protein n=1 Tax=Bradyrhizobium aeschynomenes TaxID=2734909 RepID=UPI0015553613|nr:hypothetical protein [Bradyrhizobium aeschynomenes]NPV25685.1 hypothetical protein [Bradyrhizobium aeschynomenes]
MIAKLSALASTRENWDDELPAILTELPALPPQLVVLASRQIALAARFGKPTLMDRLIAGFSSERVYVRELSLMRRTPDYAWIFLFHPNGHVREAALDSLQTPPSSAFFLAAVAWRLNDWAEPVRRAATRYVQRVQRQIAPDVVASSAPYLLDRRHSWGRWGSEADLLDEVFGRPDVLPIIVGFLQRTANGSLAKYLRLVVRYPAIDQYLPALAASAIQPQVRAIAYRCLLTGSVTWLAGYGWEWIDKIYGIRKRVPKFDHRPLQDISLPPDLFWQAARDASVIVRRAAADALIASRAAVPDEDRLIAHLEQDKNPSVRSRAAFLRRRPRPS